MGVWPNPRRQLPQNGKGMDGGLEVLEAEMHSTSVFTVGSDGSNGGILVGYLRKPAV